MVLENFAQEDITGDKVIGAGSTISSLIRLMVR
jgi:hypothetical protein